MRFVDLENTDPEGLTHDEALFKGAEVLFALWGWRWDHHRLIPDPSPAGEGMTLIAPEARTPAALLIRRARGDGSLAERARSLQTSWPSAQRLENPRHSPTLCPLEKAAAALGQRLVLALALEGFGPRPFNRIEFDPLGILPPRPFPPPASRSGAVQALGARRRTLPY